MSYADIILLGEDKDPEHGMRWQHNGEALPDAGDIVELAAPVPGGPGVLDPRHVLSVGCRAQAMACRWFDCAGLQSALHNRSY